MNFQSTQTTFSALLLLSGLTMEASAQSSTRNPTERQVTERRMTEEQQLLEWERLEKLTKQLQQQANREVAQHLARAYVYTVLQDGKALIALVEAHPASFREHSKGMLLAWNIAQACSKNLAEIQRNNKINRTIDGALGTTSRSQEVTSMMSHIKTLSWIATNGPLLAKGRRDIHFPASSPEEELLRQQLSKLQELGALAPMLDKIYSGYYQLFMRCLKAQDKK